jgi:hypothetical protein
MGMHKGKQNDQWLEAKQRCRLSDEEIRMAKELGFKPHGLIKNIPTRSQPWKAPVNEWIRRLYAEQSSADREDDAILEIANRTGMQEEPAFDSICEDDLLAQWDPVNEEPYFIRKSDGRVMSVEEAGRDFLERDASLKSEDDGSSDEFDEDIFGTFDDSEPTQAEIESEDLDMIRRQKKFRLAAEAVAEALSQLPEVEKIVLFGSVARPLKELMANRNIGVAHHQVDIFLMGPGTDRYLGRLCIFGQCPKGKEECRVEGCGERPFLRKYENFVFDWKSASQGSLLLCDSRHDTPGR